MKIRLFVLFFSFLSAKIIIFLLPVVTNSHFLRLLGEGVQESYAAA